MWAAKEIVDLTHEATVYKPTLKSAFVINRKIVNTALGRDVAEALSEYPIPVLETAICQRVALAECAAQGQTVFETAPDNPAASEIQAPHQGIVGDHRMKKVTFASKPGLSKPAPIEADAWVEMANSKELGEPTKRFTFDVPLSLHQRIKCDCAMKGVKMADVMRQMLSERFPEGKAE